MEQAAPEQPTSAAPDEVEPAAVSAPAAEAPPKSAAKPAAEPAYPPPAPQPTEAGPRGVRFDFNLGARILLPTREEGEWLVRLSDMDTGNTLFESRNKGAVVASSKRFYVRFKVEVFDEGPGVPAELGTRVFDRSVSGRASTGLGLTVARELAEADGGRLELLQQRPAVFALFLTAFQQALVV